MLLRSKQGNDGVRNTDCFTPESFAKLKEIMYEHRAPAGSYLFWDGDRADKLYFVYKGRIKITKASEEGRHFILYMHQDGDMFGQVDPFHESVHSLNAEVVEDSVIGIIQQNDLEILLWRHGDLAIEFMKWMGLMHRMTQTKFRDLMMFGKPGALCSLLIRLSNMYGERRGDGSVFISKKLTNTELADMIGATRESVNRMLSDLKKDNAVHYENSHIIIEDIDYLKDICHCENCPKDICRM